MKSLIIVLLVAVAYTTAFVVEEHSTVANKDFLVKQKKVLQLLNHIMQPCFYPEVKTIAESFKIENNLGLYTNQKAVKDFMYCLEHGMLPRGEIFSVFYDEQREEAIALFHMLYYAKDFDTFYKTACWARQYCNEGMFVYALSIAVLHREDCRGIILPPPYEIYPYYFVNSEVINRAYRIKMQQGIINPKLASYYGIEKKEQNVYMFNANYTGWYVNYNDEQKLSYFTEDIGLNCYYYYFHADYPFWMGGDQYGLKKDKRGELYYYIHQQLLARYYLERLSNGMGEIPLFSWRRPIETGYYPSLKYSNGLEFPVRSNYYDLDTEYNVFDLELVEDLERKIRDAIYHGYIYLPDGTQISLRTSDDIDILGNFIQANYDSPNFKFYHYLMVMCRSLLGTSPDPVNRHYVVPSALENFETSLRDPVFWQLYKRIIHYFIMYKDILPSYTKDELLFPGVKVENVEVDDLITYFDYFNYDITNAIYLTEDELKAGKEDMIFKVRQLRLNHKPFTVKIDVNSEKSTDCIVRIFLGPKYDSNGFLIDLEENRLNFVELDTFSYTLKTGKNYITRESSNFLNLVRDRTTTSELYKNVDSALAGSYEFVLDMSEAHNGFPDRLLLPKGEKGGMPFVFYVIVSPYRKPQMEYGTGYDEAVYSGVGTGARYIDAMPFGYPFDRPIKEAYFYTPNMYFKDVFIYHKLEREMNTPLLQPTKYVNTYP